MAKKKDTPNDLPNTAQKTKDWAQKKIGIWISHVDIRSGQDNISRLTAKLWDHHKHDKSSLCRCILVCAIQ